MTDAYDFTRIEAKWQRVWEDERAFEAGRDPAKPKFYCLEMYPYPSGRIHMGHVRNYSIGDVIARQKIMAGANVLHPIGWDALGMPAENAAIKHGTHPRSWTLDNVDHMRAQLKRMGISYDWSREVNTCLPEYYKWNQWIFLRMLEKGLAFRKESWVNWCSQCRTVLANEQVVGGGCWRCETPATQKKMEQWFLKITDYAEELLSGHAQLSKWPDHVLQMQKNWIGRSTGANIQFGLDGTSKTIEVFTTRLDTICGATFLVVSAEHPIVPDLIAGPRKSELGPWVERTAAEMRKRRDVGETEKDGRDTGKKAVNPFTGENGHTISPSTVNRALALLKTLFAMAVEWGRIETNPAARVKKLKEPPGRERYLTHEEAGRLLAAANPEFRTILTVALGTGMRRGEILSLRWEDLDLVRGIITVTMSKSGRSRRIPMSGAVTEALGGIPRRGEFVFWNEETKTHLKDVKTAFRAACVRAKITGVRFHDLRHTALSWMFQGGVSIKTVQAIAGHASIEMTARYIHERPEDQRAAVGILGAILDSTRQKDDTPPGTVTVTVPAAPAVNIRTREN